MARSLRPTPQSSPSNSSASSCCATSSASEQPGSYAHFSDVMYQKTSGKEVDFCGPPRTGKLGFEGKYIDTGWRREALTLRAALGAGVLATRGLLDTDGDIWAVPAPIIAWMLND